MLELVAKLAQALLEEEGARKAVREALRCQALLLGQLRREGVTTTTIAHRLAAARGMALPVADRIRLARRLRKRAERETARRAEEMCPSGQTASATSTSAWAFPPHCQEDAMSKLVKRTVVEEYEEQPSEEVEESIEETEDEPAEDDDERPAQRRRKSAAR